MRKQSALPVISLLFVLVLAVTWLPAVGTGSGIFVDSGQALGNSSSADVSLGDVDGDGDLDAFVAAGGHLDQPSKVWLNDGQGYFSDSGQSLGNSAGNGVRLGDLDGDSDLDAFMANQRNQPNRVWLNDGLGNFSDSGQLLGNAYSMHVALGDLDGDTDLDAFVANGDGFADQPDEVWLNDGGGIFTLGQSVGNSRSDGVDLGDLDGDGDLDAFVANRGQGNQVWLNEGDGFFLDSGQSLGDSLSHSVALGDLDRDSDLDAFVVNMSNQPDKVWLNDGQAHFTDSGQSLGSDNGRRLALGDVDEDGDLDAFVNHEGADRVWLNDGSAHFTDSGQSLDDSNNSTAVGLGDLDGDGDLDAYVAMNGYPNPGAPDKVWFNQALPADRIYISSSTYGAISGQPFADEDILLYDGSSQMWSLYFDGSDVDLDATDVNAFALKRDGSILLSFGSATFDLPGVGIVEDSDIVRFIPASLGNKTAGSFQMAFDGSDVGLQMNGEDVDALTVLPDHELLISTIGNYQVDGVSGEDEDLLLFRPTSLGWDTSGSWSLAFDGSDVGLTDESEDIWGAWADLAAGELYLTTEGSFSVDGSIGDGKDIFICRLSSYGNNTACTFGPGLYWYGSAAGFTGDSIDGFAIERAQ